MTDTEKACALIEEAERIGLRVEYNDSGFLVVTRSNAPGPRTDSAIEAERAIVADMGRRLSEVRNLVMSAARAARGKEFIGERVLIPITSIGEKTRESREGRLIRSQIAGKLADCSAEGGLTVSYLETRDDERSIERTARCASDEAFIIANSAYPSNRAPASSSVAGENIRLALDSKDLWHALELARSMGLGIEHDAGFAVVKWNVAPEDQESAEEILRELGRSMSELFRVIEDRSRGAAGSSFIDQQIFARPLDAFGVLRYCDSAGDLDVEYTNQHLGSRLRCHCGGDDVLIIVDESAARVGSADANSPKPAKNWLRRVLGS